MRKGVFVFLWSWLFSPILGVTSDQTLHCSRTCTLEMILIGNWLQWYCWWIKKGYPGILPEMGKHYDVCKVWYELHNMVEKCSPLKFPTVPHPLDKSYNFLWLPLVGLLPWCRLWILQTNRTDSNLVHFWYKISEAYILYSSSSEYRFCW